MKCVETKEVTPFQISRPVRGTAKTALGPDVATLRFVSDLPASERRTFRLEPGKPVAPDPQVTSRADGTTIIIDFGPMQVRIPATQTITGSAPGPVTQVCRGEEWAGSSSVSFAGHTVEKITTEVLDDGPIFKTFRLTYDIAGGYKYIVTLDCTAGIDFLRMYEEMKSIPPEGGGLFEFRWDGCDFTHRQMPNHPYPFPSHVAAGHRYEDYPWEPVAQMEMNTHLGVAVGKNKDGEIPTRLGVFEPWPVFRRELLSQVLKVL